MRKALFTFMVLIISSFLVNAGTINIPADYSTIQAGLNAADSSDTVLVQPGTYYENIFWPDKNGIKLISAGDSSNTIIDGGGNSTVIYISPSNATIDTLTKIQGFKIIDGGSVQDGGGIYCENASPQIKSSWVSESTSLSKGGGIYFFNSSAILLNVYISYNESINGGGLYCWASDISMFNVIVHNNQGTNNGGGGIFLGLGNATIDNSLIEGNRGSGIHLNSADLTITNSNIIANSSANGGGIFCSYSDPVLNGVQIIGNSASNEYAGGFEGSKAGGGIFCNHSDPVLTDVLILNNHSDGCGGGVYLYDFSNPSFADVKILYNTSANDGGGIYIGKSFGNFMNVNFLGNYSSADGGAICTWRSSSILDSVIINENHASRSGGGIYLDNSSTSTFTNIIIYKNSAGINGGGVYGVSNLTDVIVAHNTAQVSGGGIYGTTSANNVTVANNNALDKGGGVYLASNSTFTKCVLIDNTSKAGFEGIYISSGLLNISWSNVGFNGTGLYNIDNSNIVAAENNWWGHSSGPYHPTQNPSGQGDSVNAFVNISPFLTEPDTSAPPIPIQNFAVAGTGNDFISLAWDASPLGDLVGYKVYYDTDSTGYPYANTVDVGADTSYTLSGLPLGTIFYLAVTCYDTDDNESWYSEVSAVTRILEVQNLDIGGDENLQHLVTHSPTISFDYYDSMGETQTHYHIQISSYADFNSIDLWNTGEIANDATSVVYDGNTLEDGQNYYLRVKVASGDFLSDWSILQFRMNSKPSITVLVSPINNKVSGIPVVLKILNSTDAENDNLTYSFNVYGDAVLTEKIDSVTAVTEATDTTSWQMITTLIDNGQYWWTASANDGYEESTVSNAASFLLNSANDSPSAFALISPADSSEVITLTPILDWEIANDPDPLDTVSYNLYFGSSIPDLQLISVDTLTSYRILYPLSDNTNYYWKVVAEDLSGAATENTGGYRLFRVNTENEFPNPFSLITPTEYSVEIDLTPIFVWENNGDPDGDEITFNLYYSMDSSFTETVSVMTDSNNFIPVDSLMDNSTYFWKVIAKDSGLLQTETDTWCFWTNTELEPPNPFDLLLPKDGENCLPIVPEFVWSKATDNDPNDYAVYNLLISKDNTFSEVDVFVEGLTDTLFVLTEGLDDNNQYYWKIEAIDTDSLITSSEMFSFVVGTLSIDDLQGIPTEYSLSQNYPNPFNPTTTISYQLPKSSFVKLSIYDISGRLVDKLIDEKKNAGYYSVEWNAENVCSGVYFYRIEADNFVAVKKGLLVK